MSLNWRNYVMLVGWAVASERIALSFAWKIFRFTVIDRFTVRLNNIFLRKIVKVSLVAFIAIRITFDLSFFIRKWIYECRMADMTMMMIRQNDKINSFHHFIEREVANCDDVRRPYLLFHSVSRGWHRITIYGVVNQKNLFQEWIWPCFTLHTVDENK